MDRVRRTVALIRQALDLWLGNNAFQHAGALAFYTLFSLAPLLIIVVTITGAVFGEEAARGEIANRIDHVIGPQAAVAVQETVRRSRFEEAGLLPSLVGLGLLLFASTTVFAQLQLSLNQFWGVAARPSRSSIGVFLTTRLFSLGLVIAIGILLLTLLAVNTAALAILHYANHWVPIPPILVRAIDIGVSLLLATLLFGLIFKILPDVRLHWHDVRAGAIVTAVLFVAGQYVISIYLTRAAPASAYGAAGSLVAVLLWVYYSSLILFLGAAFTRARILQRGDHVVPKPTAVAVKTEIVERPGGDT